MLHKLEVRGPLYEITASVSLFVSPQLAMPHQWLEGNVTPGHKCVVCTKPCGSKRRLQDFTCLWCEAVVCALSAFFFYVVLLLRPFLYFIVS